MNILVHTAFRGDTVKGNLGRPEYSYYFVLREFRTLLDELGTVVEISDPQLEVDAFYASSIEQGIPCVFLSFMPPNKAPLGLACPTIPVFAWEYDTLPNESFSGKARNDWRRVLTHLGWAITHSSFTAQIVREALGADFPVIVVPAPLWERLSANYKPSNACKDKVHIDVEGMVIDSRVTDLSPYSKTAELACAPVPLPLPQDRQEGIVGLDLHGVVYTSIFNPGDGRKNWPDMISAFCMAFQNASDATLLLKLSHHDISEILPQLLVSMHRAGEFACRIIIVQGYLHQANYERMIEATSYAVNTSHGEGQCLPLMEYMSCGKPAISPCHTAMADYVDNSCAFVIDSFPVLGTWPHDMRQAFRTLRGQIAFGSLVNAYRSSYYVAKNEPETYRYMAAAAIESLRMYCSQALMKPRMEAFLNAVVANDARQSATLTS